MFAAALALAGCSTVATAPPPGPAAQAPAPDRQDALLAVASSAATVADAIGEAPPATLSRTMIDEKAVRIAFQTFDASLSVIDGFVATGAIVRGSPTALTLKRGILATRDALKAASAAQRAGNATSYRAALSQAEQALAEVRSALAR
jgi:hypothetical protein